MPELHAPVTEDEVREFIKQQHANDDNPPSDDEINAETEQIVRSVQAFESWRSSRPIEERLELRNQPVVSAPEAQAPSQTPDAAPDAPAPENPQEDTPGSDVPPDQTQGV